MLGKWSCGLGLAVAVSCFFPAFLAETSPADVYIPDPNLQSAIRTQLGLGPTDPITQQVMQNLTSLHAEASNLTGLQYANNLQNLFLDDEGSLGAGGSLCLSPLSALTQITSLEVHSSVPINNLSAISAMTGLSNLLIYGGSLQDADLRCISGLPSLSSLFIWGNDFSSYLPLSQLTKLQSLGLFSDAFSDISTLPAMPCLMSLGLGWDNLKNLNGLSNFPHITSLQISDSSLSDLSGIDNLRDIRVLTLQGDNLGDISPMHDISNLSFADLSRNAIEDISPLSNLRVSTLLLSGNPLSEYSLNVVIPAVQMNNPNSQIQYDVPEPGCFWILSLLLFFKNVKSARYHAYRMRTFCKYLRLSIFVAFLSVLPKSAVSFASTIQWVGTNHPDSNTSWGDPNNWSPRQVPGSSDEADVTSGMNDPNIYYSYSINDVWVSGTKAIFLDPNSTLTVGNGGLNMPGGGFYIEANAFLDTVGVASLGSAFIYNYGKHEACGGIILGSFSGSQGSYYLYDPGSMNYTNNAVSYVGYNGTGAFYHYSSGTVNFQVLYVGCNSGSKGTYVLKGTGLLYCPGGITVGPQDSNGRFEWHYGGRVGIASSTMYINQHGTLAYGLGGSLKNLLTGNYFDGGTGSLDISQGKLEVTDGCTLTQDSNYNASMGSLNVANGTYWLDGNSTLSTVGGISVGLDGNTGTFQWHSGAINLGGPANSMTLGANGTVDMCYDFDANVLASGGYFQGGGSLNISSGTLMVDSNGTQNSPMSLSIGALVVHRGSYYLDSNSTLSTTRGITVGNDGNTAVFQWHSGAISLDGNTMLIGAKGTLDMGFNFDANQLTAGKCFQGTGNLNISAGTLQVDNGARGSQTIPQTVSLGFLSITNGSYYLDGNGTLSTSRGISVGADGNTGTFEWSSGSIAMGGNPMTVGPNGTLAMDPNFTLNNLLSGAMFDANGRDSLNITAGTLQVQNGATATVTSGSALPTIGTLYVTNGTLSLQSGASAITVQNTLELDGNASLQSADPNNTIIIQPALDSNTASNVVITTQDGNALSGLGNLTLVCQFDPNNTQAETINLEVAGAPYDPNLVVGGVDNNFSAANFVINTLVVGRQDGDPNKHGTTLNLVNNFHDANHIAVYVRNLVMAPGGKIQLNNGFKLYYLVGNPTDGNTAKQFFPGDGNLDGKVDGVDFLLWQSNYNQNPGTNKWSTADFNGDRIVDGVDFLIWQSNYPKSGLDAVGIGPAASLANPYSPARSQIDTNGDGVISIEEAQKAFDGLDMNR